MDRSWYDRYWEGNAAAPDRDPTTRARERRLLEALRRFGVPERSRVLDLGCGAGGFCRLLHRAGYAPFGVDLSAKAVERASRENPGLEFAALGPSLSIPAPDGHFEAVWSSEVLEHVFDVPAHLAEVNRVLKPGGLYVLTTPYHGRVKNVLVSLWKFSRHFMPEGEHIRFFDREGLERCLSRAGFDPLEWSGIGRFWPVYRTWFVVSRKARPALPLRPGETAP